jgi:hypothetical protein
MQAHLRNYADSPKLNFFGKKVEKHACWTWALSYISQRGASTTKKISNLAQPTT